MQWALKILNAFPDIEESFVTKNKNSNYSFASNSPQVIYDIMKARRSNRKWAIEQPSAQDLHDHALQMIQAAITAPCSGNRQGVRFRIILDEEEKILLKGIKEHHCYSAPLLIFIGAESDVYYSLGESDINCRYLDAAASAMQIINYATAMNYGTCWNHFDKYMVHSRKKNTEIYNNFCKKLNIPSNIEPIAIIAIGKTKYVVPTPVRMDINSFILK
ncbi:nitroreductase family protein [uncultured Draconibacterium sp.]|uniref:nitroreductase family protein n=1 Tax=uncultured Draconibacterium sp. TaxID=1573823 RepID=UPI003260307D